MRRVFSLRIIHPSRAGISTVPRACWFLLKSRHTNVPEGYSGTRCPHSCFSRTADRVFAERNYSLSLSYDVWLGILLWLASVQCPVLHTIFTSPYLVHPDTLTPVFSWTEANKPEYLSKSLNIFVHLPSVLVCSKTFFPKLLKYSVLYLLSIHC